MIDRETENDAEMITNKLIGATDLAKEWISNLLQSLCSRWSFCQCRSAVADLDGGGGGQLPRWGTTTFIFPKSPPPPPTKTTWKQVESGA